MKFKLDTSKLQKGIEMFSNRFDSVVKAYAETSAKKLESYAKENARWQDRTGRARRAIRGYIEERQEKVRIIISHGVEYGVWLELAHEKKFAILWDTIFQNSNDILKGFEKMLERIGNG